MISMKSLGGNFLHSCDLLMNWKWLKRVTDSQNLVEAKKYYFSLPCDHLEALLLEFLGLRQAISGQ